MKKLLAALFLLSLMSCGPDAPPDKSSTVVITHTLGIKDTVNIEYYRDLHLDGDYLHDGNHKSKALYVIAYSIINTKSISK